MNILSEMKNIGIIPVVCIKNEEYAVSLAKALIDGGLPAAEITFRTDAAEGAIRKIATAYPDMLVGAGTVLSVEQAKTAVDAGAKFIVSPGFNPKVVSWCTGNNIPVLPGCTTPSEIEQAIELGLDTVKFFPAEQSGGLAKIKALSAPYTGMKFMPTGGINLQNMHEYLSFKKIIACGGSFMVKTDAVDAGDWNGITSASRDTVKALLDFKLAHIGINSDAASDTARLLTAVFGGEVTLETDKGIFVDGCFEIMKGHDRGRCGHIAVSTPDVDRAVYYLEKRGVKFIEDSALKNPDGTTHLIYIDSDFDGFMIHLVEA
ncbi:MAG: bifunctional 4-hydroxy-2-oxoglutarate aldolase/2-dehydro-3-deoxy-phosphogluconate aldolase [Clostridiales bacterium]|nr:bifunctional 4-hydroxy-2-oxoglutarate aldolase/2-dehydro-3-deoxy-phosphogluconate aldolase [Clostridiales bacterium]